VQNGLRNVHVHLDERREDDVLLLPEPVHDCGGGPVEMPRRNDIGGFSSRLTFGGFFEYNVFGGFSSESWAPFYLNILRQFETMVIRIL
jgi:hypothetical protein